MTRKYEFTGETKDFYGVTLKQIRALVTIAHVVTAGDIGGWIEGEKNFSPDAQVSGNAWVSGNAQVYGDAQVYGNAQVSGNAWVSGNAQVYGDAQVYGNAQVSGDAWVYGDAQVYGDAWVYGDAQVYGNARVYGNAQVQTKQICASRSDGYLFVCYPQKDGLPTIIAAGCRFFTFDEAKAHWTETRKGTPLGQESLLLVSHLEAMAKIQGWLEEPKKAAAE